MSVLVSGSIAIDNVKTQKASQENLLGGSASYAAIAANYFSPVGLVGVVGHDFPAEHLEVFKSREINLEGLEFSEGETFRWSGEYMEDMNDRETLAVALNVLESWLPAVAESQKSITTVNLLANAHPLNQHSVVDQLGTGPGFTIADTMDLWIQISRPELESLLKRIDLLVLNDSEAKLMMDTSNVVAAGHSLRTMGPKYVIIKKGEHGAMLFGENEFFACPAFPLHDVFDPTGAGDSFIGGFAGYLASLGKSEYTFSDLTSGIARGTILASFTCESFSTHSLESLTQDVFETRLNAFRSHCKFS
ncbi:MAG: carbohydrate kinase [Verrucomicrobiales bacterium]|nr:carbohydrate kinase [Verrucomicrobiales bacterium]MBP9224826.1 carbohydrate kinase [Verrucomicrobiales bacterium]HQZ27981.1 PfkB family carbohydrate kinase [Verrucomicrobiales bacterium]